MPTFMDVHQMPGATADKVAQAHQKDLAVEGRHGVRFLRYWVDEQQGKVFCLSEAPSAEAALAAHREAGNATEEIYRVREGQ